MVECKIKNYRKRTGLGEYGFCKLHTRKTDSDNKIPDISCCDCNRVVLAHDKAMSCDMCSEWFFLACIENMTDETIEALIGGADCQGLNGSANNV